MREWWFRLTQWITGRERVSDDLAEEIQTHLEMDAEDRAARGLPQGEALDAARRHFGNPTRVAEEARASWGFPSLESLIQDVRYALRAMRRTPALTVVIVLTLALGIGVNTAIFSVLNTVVLKPLPYPGSERLVWWGESTGKATGISVTWVNYRNWLQGNHTMEEMAAYHSLHLTLTGGRQALMTRGLAVTSRYFPILGMKPVLGRFWTDAEDRPGANRAVVLNHRFWAEELGGDPAIAGKSIRLDGELYEVTGVAAPIWAPTPVDYYLSLGARSGSTTDRSKHGSIRALGRLKPGVTLDEARTDLDTIMRHLAEADPGPENAHRSFGRFYAEEATGEVRGMLLVLMGAALLVLLIACANVASLLLARNTARSGELAIRTAIGAGRPRLIRQLLTENLVLAACGGLSGILLAGWALRTLILAAPRGIPRLAEIALDLPVLLFACALTLGTGLLAGLAPVFTAGRVDLTTALKDSARSSGGRRRQRVRSALVVSEIALTLVLAFASGLLLRSLAAAQNSDPGYEPRNVLALELLLPQGKYADRQARENFYNTLMENLRTVPGIAQVSAIRCPPGHGDCPDWFYSIPGQPVPTRNEVPIALFNSVTPTYFETMRVPVRQGRVFSGVDVHTGPKVAIVNETFARQWWPTGSAVGHQIKVGGPYIDGPLLEIAGVVGDVRQDGLDSQTRPEIYVPFSQQTDEAMAVMIRTAGDPSLPASAIRTRVGQLDRDLPVQRLTVMEQNLRNGLERRRFITLLLGLFAGLALALAAVGIYGLLNYWVSVREAEIAIRLALGATPASILSWTSGHALRLALTGVVLGGAGSWLAATVLTDFVFGIPARNPGTLALAGLAVAAIAVASAAIPAWRASRVDAARRLHCA
ncbi:ABC transporter permease [uncultured Paludibaculum sp.]|uniref:ABC transporter permease n=1 Tax=uncultured Paludibaculum sp. TaxID=1765020 RepID=UPI002AAAB94F|nr:ABC transporter permease [uncultured Paludibaculum sp.]